MIDQLVNKIHIPIILHGGASKISDIQFIGDKYEIEGVGISSLLHYNYLNKIDYSESKKIGNTDFLKNTKKNNDFENTNLIEIKQKLNFEKLAVRISHEWRINYPL